MGYTSLFSKFKLPTTLMYTISHAAQLMNKVFNSGYRLSPFAVNMMIIDRYFDISESVDELGYEPVIEFEEGWKQTIDWFIAHEEYWKMCADRTGASSD